jgi:hypothetical protein
MLTRSSLLNILLTVAIALVVTKNYWLWMSDPWDLPNPGKVNPPIVVEDAKAVVNPRPVTGTETISARTFLTRNGERG